MSDYNSYVAEAKLVCIGSGSCHFSALWDELEVAKETVEAEDQAGAMFFSVLDSVSVGGRFVEYLSFSLTEWLFFQNVGYMMSIR